MRSRVFPRTPGRSQSSAVGVGVILFLLVASPSGLAAGITPLPIALDGRFLQNLSAPVLAPGTSGSLGFVLMNPLGMPMSGLSLTFSVYAFNGFPGNATGSVISTSSVTLTGGSGSGLTVAFALSTLSPGIGFMAPLSFAASGSAPQGTFAIRTSLSFIANGSGYLLESRGFFSASAWANATTLPGGGSTLNLSRLGVSGVLPETAVLVRSNELTLPLYGILAAGVILAAAGGYVASRRGPGSRSGASGSPDESKAPKALGKRRNRDGD